MSISDDLVDKQTVGVCHGSSITRTPSTYVLIEHSVLCPESGRMCFLADSTGHASTPAGNHADGPVPSFVPSSNAGQEAYKVAKASLPPAISNHSVRVFLHARWLLGRGELPPWAQSADDRLSLLFIACMFHDMGCASQCDGDQRFEVEGADAADTLMRQYGFSEADAHEVWVAIALHTSSGIAERISSLAKIVREAVLMDFGFRAVDEDETRKQMTEVENAFPRLNAEKVLSDAVVEQALRQPKKAPTASWPGDLLRAKKAEPEWQGVNKAF